jgi:hypothetical protein
VTTPTPPADVDPLTVSLDPAFTPELIAIEGDDTDDDPEDETP